MGASRDLSSGARRWGIRLAYANALFWAIGNGFVSSQLIVYLAVALGAQGLAVGGILAAPHLFGVLRLASPYLFIDAHVRKWTSVGCLFSSSFLLMIMPFVASPRKTADHAYSITVLIVFWCVYHLLEYVGVIGLWSWLGDLVPARIRGRVIGRRERFLAIGRIFGLLVSAFFVEIYQQHSPNQPKYISYFFPTMMGAALMAFSVWPLVFMPVSAAWRKGDDSARRGLVRVWGNRRFWPLLAYGGWMAGFNGLGDAARRMFLPMLLKAPLELVLTWEALMRTGQFVLAPEVGKQADRIGNRRVLITSQILVAFATVFFLVATPDQTWLVGGFWIFNIAYVGLNIGLPNVTLRLAPPGTAAAHFAVYHSTTGLITGIAMVAGGWLMETLQTDVWASFWMRTGWDVFRISFLVTLVARLAAVFFLRQLDERVDVRC